MGEGEGENRKEGLTQNHLANRVTHHLDVAVIG